MSNKQLKPGDKIYHKSDSSTIWVIESLDEKEIYCSTLNKETKQLQKEKFLITTIEKIEENDLAGRILWGKSDNNHRW